MDNAYKDGCVTSRTTWADAASQDGDHRNHAKCCFDGDSKDYREQDCWNFSHLTLRLQSRFEVVYEPVEEPAGG